ncbi:MAG: polysaccharide deacetylase family protein [Deltaproteobacteria bacterium]|nr:polysaccharide deacetylase family protein [Kofleriaceae bacterium]
MLRRLLVGIALTLGAGSAWAESAHGHDGLGGAAPTRGDGPRYMVAFTFDDGPSETFTPRILRALAKHDVPATFFVVGRDLADRPKRRALLGAIARAGHAIGNHTFGHARLTALAPAARDAELDRLAAIVEAETGTRPTTVRPPYGASSPTLRAALAARGLTEVRWNVDPRDWAFTDPEPLRAAVLDAIIQARGGIVLLHDTERVTALAFPGVLADLEAWNCARVRRGKEPILPVSLHYFLRDGETPRPVPPEVEARTERFRDALLARCGPEVAD